MTTLRFVSLLALPLLLASCFNRAKEPKVDLNRIYGKAAQKEPHLINPIIIIPGILGSKLIDPTTQKPIWGDFDQAFRNPNRPKDVPFVALPLHGTGQPVKGVPNAILSATRLRILGFRTQQRAYSGILN